MSKSKLLKYEVINTKKDKNLIGEVFDFKKVKSKGSDGNGGRKPIKPKAPAWFADFRNEVMQRFDEQAKFNKSIRQDFNRVVKLNSLKH